MPRPTAQQLIAQAGEKRGVEALRNIPPVVIAASMIDGFDPQRPDTLLHRAVKLTPAVHPLLDAVLTESGATRRGSRTYSVSVNRDADPSVLLAALAAIPGNLCYPESYAPMATRAGGFRYLNRYSAARTLETQLRALPVATRGMDLTKMYEMHPYGTYGAPHPEANVAVVVSVQAAQVYFRICTDQLRIPTSPEDLLGADMDLLTTALRRDPLELPAHEALYLLEEARRAKFTVVDLSPSGRELRDLRELLSTSVSVHPVAGAPAEAVVVAGADVSPRKGLPKLDASRTTSVARQSAGEAVAAAAGVKGRAPVVVDRRVADVGAMALAEPFDESGLVVASLGGAGGVVPSLRPYQREAVGVHLATERGYVQASAPGLGKGHPVDTQVLTPAGWVRIGDVRVGDELIGSAGTPVRVTGVYPKGVLPVIRAEFSDGASVLCDEDHLWTVRRKGSDASAALGETAQSPAPDVLDPRCRLTPAQRTELASRLDGTRGNQAALAREYGVSTTLVAQYAQRLREEGLDAFGHRYRLRQPVWQTHETRWLRDRIASPSGERTWRIPLVAPVAFPPRELPVPAYTLGVFLGDGTSRSCRKVLFSTGVPAELTPLLQADLGPEYYPNLQPAADGSENAALAFATRPAHAPNPLADGVAALGLAGLYAHEKFVPEAYLLAPAADRLALLQGLMDTDGSVTECDNHLEFASSSENLAHAVQELVRSLGGTARINPGTSWYTYRGERLEGRIRHRVSIQMPAGMQPFRLPSKLSVYRERSKYPATRILVGMEPAGEAEVVCISVAAPDHLYVTEHYILTHNTVVSLTAARAKAARLLADAGTADAEVPAEAVILDSDEARVMVAASVATTPRYRALVAVPAAIRSQWGREAARWFPEAKVVTLTSKADAELVEDTLAAAGSTPVLVVASYEMTARNVAMLEKTRWNDLFCDEAVVLKNPGSERSKALWRLREVSEVAVALTGTPIDKSLDDLGRLVAWVRGEAEMFDGQRLAKRFDMQDEASIEGFRRAIGPILFRRDRSEIADELPAIETEVVLLDPSPAELRLATAARRELKRIYTELCERLERAAALDPSDKAYQDAKVALAEARGAMLGGVTLARMAASDPHAVAASDSAGALLLANAGLVEAATKRLGTKRSQIVELCADLVARGESVLLFTDFSSVAENLVADLRERETPVGAILGGQSDKARTAAALQFQEGEPSVLVCTAAAREGLNLQRATVLVHYDLPWNPSAVVQRQARANRIGATGEKLSVLIPIMTGTIEERVASIVVSRATLALTALDTSRGVDARTTELGQALVGLIDAASAAELGKDATMLDLAREILG